jgi:glutathione S-transferase
MLHLHYYPSTASMVPHILLEELAVPYQRVLVTERSMPTRRLRT